MLVAHPSERDQTKGKTTMGTNLISFRVRDDGGKSANVKVFVPDTYTVAQMNAFAVAFADELDSVTAAKIESATVRLQLDLSTATLKASAIADRPINWGVNIGLSAANTSYRHTVFVPSIDAGLVDGGVFDYTDQLVVDMTNLLVTGDGTVAPSDEYENDLTAVLGGEVTFRK